MQDMNHSKLLLVLCLGWFFEVRIRYHKYFTFCSVHVAVHLPSHVNFLDTTKQQGVYLPTDAFQPPPNIKVSLIVHQFPSTHLLIVTHLGWADKDRVSKKFLT